MPTLGGYEYSDKEVKLIEALDLMDSARSRYVPPVLLYNCMAVACFRKALNNEVSDSARRCLLELEKPMTGIPRLTPEFDALITL